MTIDFRIHDEHMRLSRVFKALWEDYKARLKRDQRAQTWCNTELFDIFLPDKLTVIGQTRASTVPGVKRRREHLIPRLAVAERCIEMFEEGASLEEVALFLQNFLKIIWVSSDEAKRIDAPGREQKSQMPQSSVTWWREPESIYLRLENAEIRHEDILEL